MALNFKPFKDLTFGVATALSVPIGLVSDLLTPVKTPYGFYIATILLICFFLSVALVSIPVTNKYIKGKFKEYWYLPFALFLLITSILLFSFHHLSNKYSKDNKGVFASNFLEFSDLQQSLGIIQKNTTAIAINTKRISNISQDILDVNIDASNPIENLYHAMLRGDVVAIKRMEKSGQDISIVKTSLEDYEDAILLSAARKNKKSIIKVIEYLVQKEIIGINDFYPTNTFRNEIRSIEQALKQKEKERLEAELKRYQTDEKAYLEEKSIYEERLKELRKRAFRQARQEQEQINKKHFEDMEKYSNKESTFWEKYSKIINNDKQLKAIDRKLRKLGTEKQKELHFVTNQIHGTQNSNDISKFSQKFSNLKLKWNNNISKVEKDKEARNLEIINALGGKPVKPEYKGIGMQAAIAKILVQLVSEDKLVKPNQPKREDNPIYNVYKPKFFRQAKITLLQEARYSRNSKLENWLLSNGADSHKKGYIILSDNSKLPIE